MKSQKLIESLNKSSYELEEARKNPEINNQNKNVDTGAEFDLTDEDNKEDKNINTKETKLIKIKLKHGR